MWILLKKGPRPQNFSIKNRDTDKRKLSVPEILLVCIPVYLWMFFMGEPVALFYQDPDAQSDS